jgi:Pyridoxamine 5'-phosphate oxidase
MRLLSDDEFDNEDCLAFFGRACLGRIGVSLSAVPVVFPVAYLVSEPGFLVGVSSDEVAEAMAENVVALQADGWAEDSERRWTTLAVGLARRVSVQDEAPLPARALAGNPWDERHVFRLRPHILSGRWMS